MGRICANTGCNVDISNDHPLAKRCKAHRGKGDRRAQTERAKANGTKAAAQVRWKQARPAVYKAKKERNRLRKAERERPMHELRRNIRKALTAYKKAYLRTLANAQPKMVKDKSPRVYQPRSCVDCGSECAPSYRCPSCKVERNRQHDRNRGSVKRAHRRGYKTGVGRLKEKDRRVLIKQSTSCAGCGSKDAKLTIDHVIPLVHGGTNELINLQMLCLSCNVNKGAQSDADWRRNKFGQLC